MSRKILIADNDRLLSALVKEGLESAGYQASVASDGLETWEAIQKAAPDVLVLDLIMPKLDGSRLCRRLKADPRFRSLPVIILTGTAVEAAGQLKALGADAYIAKRPAQLMIQDLLHTLQAMENGERPGLAGTIQGAGQVCPRQIVIELLSETSHLTAILDHLGEGVLVVDPSGRLLYVNPAGADLLQRPEGELLGAELLTILGAGDGDPLRQTLHHLAVQGNGRSVELIYTHHERFLQITLTNLLEGGKVAGHLLLLREVTALFRRIEELVGLNELASLFTSALPLDELLCQVMERIRELMGGEAASLLLTDPETGELVFRAAVGKQGKAVDGRRLEAGVGIAGWVLQRGEPVIVPDVQQDPRFYRGVDATTGFVTRSMLCVPLKSREKIIGVIQILNSPASAPFTREALSLLTAISAQAATAIENAVLHQQTVARNRALHDLLETSRDFGSILKLEVLLRKIVRKTLELVPAGRSGIVLLDEMGGHGDVQASLSNGRALKERPRLDLARYPELRKAIQSREPVVVVDALTDPLMQSVRELIEPIGVRSLLVIPLVSNGKVIGALNVACFDQVRRFTTEEVELCQTLANHASVAIENARLYGQVTRHATELEQKVDERTRELLTVNACLEQSSRHKSEFLANMSHELRTPLNSIIGFADLLLAEGVGPLIEKQARYLSHIHNSGKHLLQLISDILDLSKVEAGKFVLQPEALTVGTTLEDILVIGRGLAHKKSQAVTADIQAALPPLRADPVRLKQILFNLLSNAVKFTPDGGRIIVTARRVNWSSGQLVDSAQPIDQLTTQPIDAGGEWLETRVTDTGAGIRPEDLPRLFREFTQLEATQDQRHEGAGLGLALTKRLVELHGGRILAESEGAGKGSTFTVLLPFGGGGGAPEIATRPPVATDISGRE